MAFGARKCIFFFLLCLLLIGVRISSAQLSPNCYLRTCPKALSTINSVVTDAVSKEYRMGASLLRLHFHDCFVNGCDASVLLDDTSSFTGEKNARPNKDSLRGFELIDTIKSELESMCPGVVSCADILAVAARDSVVALGGPTWIVQLGRRDSTTASLSDAESNIPSPRMDLSAIVTAFSNKGFTAKEMVALLGAHTIGQARCFTFRDRLYNESLIDTSFATSVKLNCPISLGDDNLTALDVTSPVTFDNGYFKSLVNNKGLLHSDQQLFSGGTTDSQVNIYKASALNFFFDFAKAIVKMGNLSVLTGTSGQIRTNCAKVN